MSRKIRIKAGSVEATAVLGDTRTAEAIWEALPVTAKANTWGDEVYFSIPVKCAAENPKETVELGDLGYWMPGSAFCIFFGPTPMSGAGEIRPASGVNVFGKVEGDPKVFKKVSQGTTVTVDKAEK
jgi:hypothetical protein